MKLIKNLLSLDGYEIPLMMGFRGFEQQIDRRRVYRHEGLNHGSGSLGSTMGLYKQKCHNFVSLRRAMVVLVKEIYRTDCKWSYVFRKQQLYYTKKI